MSIILSILGIMFALGAVIFVHEFGHFIVAKKSGVKVEQFSFGFGPEIFGFLWGETRYSLNWIPLGGFVRMAGELPEDYEGPVLEGKGDSQSPKDGGDHSRDFMAKPWYMRILVATAGPVMNYGFSIFLFFSLFMIAGIPEQVNKTEIGAVVVGMPAEKAGLKQGDKILEVEGKAAEDFFSISQIIAGRANQPTKMKVQRGEATLEFTLTPKLNEKEGRAFIGIQAAAPILETRKLGPLKCFNLSIEQCWGVTIHTLAYLGQKIRTFEKPKDVAGPIGIFQLTADAVKRGPKEYFFFIALISVAIGLFNLFPIPMLDGGHIFYYLVEGIRRKPLSPKFISRANTVGMVLLLGILAFATMNDINRVKDSMKAKATQPAGK